MLIGRPVCGPSFIVTLAAPIRIRITGYIWTKSSELQCPWLTKDLIISFLKHISPCHRYRRKPKVVNKTKSHPSASPPIAKQPEKAVKSQVLAVKKDQILLAARSCKYWRNFARPFTRPNWLPDCTNRAGRTDFPTRRSATDIVKVLDHIGERQLIRILPAELKDQSKVSIHHTP